MKSSLGGKRHKRRPHVPNSCSFKKPPFRLHPYPCNICQCHTRLFPRDSWAISFFLFALLCLPSWLLLVYSTLNMGSPPSPLNSGVDLAPSASTVPCLFLHPPILDQLIFLPSFMILSKLRSVFCVPLSFQPWHFRVVLDNSCSSINHGPLATKSCGFFLLNEAQICFFQLCYLLSPVFYHYPTSRLLETIFFQLFLQIMVSEALYNLL